MLNIKKRRLKTFSKTDNMIPKRVYLITIASFFALGAIILLNSFQSLTSFVIFENADKNYGSFVGLWLIITSLVLFTVATTERKHHSELEIRVYDGSNGKDKNQDRAFILEDTRLEFGGDPIKLGEFKKEIARYHQEKGGEELVGIIRDTYGPGLREIAQSSDTQKAKIAREFLAVLGETYKEPERNYRLTKDEREEIKYIFRGWTGGRLNSDQIELIRNYGFSYHQDGKGKHQFYIKNELTGIKEPIQGSPSDWRSGKNFVSELIKIVEESREIEAKKKKD